MEFTIKITKKDIIIGVLSVLLILVSVGKVTFGEATVEPTANYLRYGMADNDVNYNIVYDQINNVSQVSAELFGDADTIQIDGEQFIKTPTEVKGKLNTILYEDRDSTKAIRS